MQKRVAPGVLRRPCRQHHVTEGEHRLVRDAGVIARGLRTVRAILGTAPGLDRQQRRKLDVVRGVMRTVHGVRAVQEIVERQVDERRHGGDGPPPGGRVGGFVFAAESGGGGHRRVIPRPDGGLVWRRTKLQASVRERQ
jgi:hypothetical protein